jgi:hypothetical protein
MHYVSLIVEFLRGRPAVVFWTAALAQATLWFLVPAVFYSAPPGDVALILAFGHEFRLGSHMGPPLAFWLGELAFRVAGIYGVYLLAQACIVLTFWAVFELGRAIVGVRHAVLAILLMAGIAAYNVPSPEFGPSTVALPLWALSLLHYWRAVGDDRRGYWFLLAVDLGLLLLADYIGVLLVFVLLLFTAASPRGRRALFHMEPWLALVLLAIVVFPHLIWLKEQWPLVYRTLMEPPPQGAMLPPTLWLAAVLLLSHVGVGLLVLLASGWRLRAQERAPEIDRMPVAVEGRIYVYALALGPAALALGLVLNFDRLGPAARIGPLVALTALAVIVAAGDRIYLFRERMVSMAWIALLTVPPFLVVVAILVLPWTVAYPLSTGAPAKAMGTFFAENFQRRVGKPLPFVAGDPQLAALVALNAPSRPRLYLGDAPDKSPWTDAAALRANGAILVWPATDTAGSPPPSIKAAFPDIVPELPRAFERPIQGLLPLTRIGWAVLRPR